MSFIPGYSYDIFISFAQIDNASLPGQSDGWIEQFYKNLNLMLARRIGFLDTVKIRCTDKNPDGIIKAEQSSDSDIQKSAILICLNSNGYTASASCKKELEIFYNKTQAEKAGMKVNEHSHIIHVLLNPIPVDKWPVELSGTTEFHFFNAKENSDFGETLKPNSPGFKTQMQKLADEVWKLLNNFSQEQTAGSKQQQTIPEENKKIFTIYMSEVADTLRTSRKRIISELMSKGYNVLTGVPPPDESDAHEKATHDALKKADISVHLLDEIPGREISGDLKNWYPKKQTELSLISGKPQMIWVPEETDFEKIEEENYKFFLQSIEKGNPSAKGYEFVRGPKCTLTQDIIDFAEHTKVVQTHRNTGKWKISVMLDTHFNDQQYAIDLGKILLENHIRPFINPQEDDPKKNMNLMSERLKQVDKMIFLYGSVSKEWVRERMSASLELIISNNYPIDDFYIFMVPPSKEPKNIFIDQRFLNISVIDSSKNANMNKAELQYFLKALNTVKE